MSRLGSGSYRLFAPGSRPAMFPVTSASADLVSEPTPQYAAMAGKWELINDLLGGTDAMRAKGERWLPREEIESMKAYRVRLAYSFLFGAFRDTIDKLKAKPFSRDVTVRVGEPNDDAELPPRLKALVDDADGAGTSLTGVCSRVFEMAAAYGIAHVMADVSATRPTQTAAEDAQNMAALLPIDPRNVIGWSSERVGGAERLTMVRIVEERWERTGKFGQKLQRYVRVIYAPGHGPAPAKAVPADGAAQPAAAAAPAKPRGMWELYKVSSDGKNGEPVETGEHSFDGVPLFTVYFKKVEFMQAEPPLLGLAELCLNHWQSSSNQNFALRVGRFSMLKMTGISQAELEKPVAVGPTFTFRSVNPTADFGVVESSGAPLKSGLEDLQRIESRMEQLGLQPLVQTTADSTAIGKRIDEGKSETTMQAWIRAVETCVSNAATAALEWAGESLPEGGVRVDIFSDFGIASSAKDDATTLLAAHAAGALTTRTLLAEFQRRNIVSADLNVDDEAGEAETKAAEALNAQLDADVGGGFGGDPAKDKPAGGDPAKDPAAE